MRISTLALGVIAAAAVAMPTASSAGKGPYWNCYASAPRGPLYVPPQRFPRWTKAQATRQVLRECRQASGGRRCKISECFHESGDPSDPGCKHCVLPRAAPSPYR